MCCVISGAFQIAQVPAAPLSVASMAAGFGIALLVFGLPAMWWMRKNCKETNKNVNRINVAQAGDVESGGARQHAVPSIKNVARAIIHAQRAMDDLQRGMLRSMVSEMERKSAQELAKAQEVQIKGTKGERREALRQKHRHQRAALANQLDAVDMGLNKILQDQGVSAQRARAPSRGIDPEEKKKDEQLARQESKRVLAQYDQHVEEMSKQLRTRAQSQSENLEKKLEEKRALMKERLMEMEKLMERQGVQGHIVAAPQPPPKKAPGGAGGAAVESAKKRQTRAVAVKKMDLTGDGQAESTGYDTNGDGVIDAIDYDGARTAHHIILYYIAGSILHRSTDSTVPCACRHTFVALLLGLLLQPVAYVSMLLTSTRKLCLAFFDSQAMVRSTRTCRRRRRRQASQNSSRQTALSRLRE